MTPPLDVAALRAIASIQGCAADCSKPFDQHEEERKQYRAATSPAVVLELLTELESARLALRAAEGERDELRDSDGREFVVVNRLRDQLDEAKAERDAAIDTRDSLGAMLRASIAGHDETIARLAAVAAALFAAETKLVARPPVDRDIFEEAIRLRDEANERAAEDYMTTKSLARERDAATQRCERLRSALVDCCAMLERESEDAYNESHDNDDAAIIAVDLARAKVEMWRALAAGGGT